MGHIQKRTRRDPKTGKRTTAYQARYRGPDGKERSRRFDRRVDAERWLDTNGAILPAVLGWTLRLAQFCLVTSRNWLANRRDLRPRTAIQYRSVLNRHLLPAFSAVPMAKVTPSSIGQWHSALVAIKPAAAANAYRLLREIFNSAVRDDLLLRSPCRVPRGGADRAVERPMLTLAEVKALADAMPENLRTAVILAAWGGLRRGEVLGLRRRDVDSLRSRVRVEQAQVELSNGTVIFAAPKTDAGFRTVHLPAHAMQSLEEHLINYVSAEPDALVFTGRGGVPMRPRTLATAFRSARTLRGLTDVHFHDLRHFALTMAAATGATTKELMRRAGHATPSAALRYQHATEDRDRAIAEALAGLVRGADIVEIARTNRGQSHRRT